MYKANCRLCGRFEEVAHVDTVGPICVVCADVDNGAAEPRPVKILQREHHWLDRCRTIHLWVERIRQYERN